MRHRVDEQVDELGSKASQAADCVLYFVVKDLEHNSIADICTICQDLTDLLITNCCNEPGALSFALSISPNLRGIFRMRRCYR